MHGCTSATLRRRSRNRSWPRISPDELEFGTPEADAWIARISAAMERSKLVRTIDDGRVDRAAREETFRMTLPDGRTLQIGGEIQGFR